MSFLPQVPKADDTLAIRIQEIFGVFPLVKTAENLPPAEWTPVNYAAFTYALLTSPFLDDDEEINSEQIRNFLDLSNDSNSVKDFLMPIIGSLGSFNQYRYDSQASDIMLSAYGQFDNLANDPSVPETPQNQEQFEKALLKHQCRCLATGAYPPSIDAAHIIPSEVYESHPLLNRLNIGLYDLRNGMLLGAGLHAIFDAMLLMIVCHDVHDYELFFFHPSDQRIQSRAGTPLHGARLLTDHVEEQYRPDRTLLRRHALACVCFNAAGGAVLYDRYQEEESTTSGDA